MPSITNINTNQSDLSWDLGKIGTGMILSENNHHIFLK